MTVVCDIMLPAVLAITHTLTTYYIFSGLPVKGLSKAIWVRKSNTINQVDSAFHPFEVDKLSSKL